MTTELNKFTEQFQLDDQAININDLPWIPQSDRVWFKPLRFDLTTGSWINLLKVKPGGAVNRHRHSGGKVMAYTLQGQWRYLEREWRATPGSFVYEPPGDIHTLVVDGEEEMITLFILEGIIQYLDDNDNVISQDDLFSKMNLYYKYCEEHNIPIQNLKY